MALVIRKRIPNDQFPAHDWHVIVTPVPVKSRIQEGPRTEAERQAAANAAMETAFKVARLEGAPEEEAVAIATQRGMDVRKQLAEVGMYDQRAVAVLAFYAEDPGEDLKKRAKPAQREQINYDHDFAEGAANPLKQAYEAIKASKNEDGSAKYVVVSDA